MDEAGWDERREVMRVRGARPAMSCAREVKRPNEIACRVVRCFGPRTNKASREPVRLRG